MGPELGTAVAAMLIPPARSSAGSGRTIDSTFAQIAQQNRDVTALIDGGEAFTYGDLLDCSTRLADYIRTFRPQAEEAVAIWGSRSVEFVVAALAIMQAGCAYVPLDLESPHSRIGAILSVARVRLLIVAGEHDPECHGPFGDFLRDISVARGKRPMTFAAKSLLTEPALPVPAASTPASPLAFLMFTSGSAGMPKGVMIEHGAVLALVDGLEDYVDVSPGRTMLNLSRTSFDATTFEIWGPLLRGATIAIYPQKMLDLEDFRDFLRQHRVNIAWLTAGLFHEIMLQDPSILEPIMQLAVGGDVVPPSHFNAFLEARPGRRIVNGYGPTEATTFTMTFAATQPIDPAGGVPIGRPIRGARAYVLTRDLQPVEPGTPGELHIGGTGLARGYIGENRRKRDFMTGFVDGTLQRLYASGDFVRQRADGNFDYLGRDDEQVKIRGFRVELPEIERCVEGLPGVRRAVVVARREEGSVSEVVAVIVDDDTGPGRLADLRERVRAQLPDYMIPTRWFVADRIPLTANGKVDRIRAAQGWGTELFEASTSPADGTCADVLALCREILGRSTIGVDDAFYDVGVNSLTATRIVAKIRGRFGVQFSIADFNAGGTARGVGRMIDEQRSNIAEPYA